MLNFRFCVITLLLLISNIASAQSICKYPNSTNTYPATPYYADIDGDDKADSPLITYHCDYLAAPKGYSWTGSAMHYSEDGKLVIDCAPNDASRGVSLVVWPDADEDDFTPNGAKPKIECYMSYTRSNASDRGFYPEDEDYRWEKFIRFNSVDAYDCNDNVKGESSWPYYIDNNNDGYGAGNSIADRVGTTCDRTKSINYYDCDDNDPLVMQSYQIAYPDKKVCNESVFKIVADDLDDDKDGKDFSITIRAKDLLMNRDPEKDVVTRTFNLYGITNGTRDPTVYVYPCYQNCAPWTLTTKGVLTWTNIDFGTLNPVEPYEDGIFDPKKPAQFRVKLSVANGFQRPYGYLQTKYLVVNYEPECEDLQNFAGVVRIFNSGFDKELKKPQGLIADGGKVVDYAPVCTSSKLTPQPPVAIDDLKKAMKIDHFNFWQSFQMPSMRSYTISQSLADQFGQVQAPSSVKANMLNEEGGFGAWLLDPHGEAKPRLLVKKDPFSEGFVGTALPATDFDMAPFYYNETTVSPEPFFYYKNHVFKYEMKFEDYPSLTSGWFDPNESVSFIMRLGAVSDTGSFVVWTAKTVRWRTRTMNPYLTYDNFTISNLAMPSKPAHWDELVKETYHDGVEVLDLVPTPPLVGRNVINVEANEKYLKDSGFRIEVTNRVARPDLPEGYIISQSPNEWEEVSKAGVVKVVVSGKPKDCGTITHGASTTRVKYLSSTVPFGKSCDSVKEIQTATCDDGNLNFSGTATSSECKVEVQPTQCSKAIKKICKAGLLHSEKCELPKDLISVKIDPSYKGSSCHEAPKTITIFNVLKLINSYSISDSIRANFGCNAQFEVKYKDLCDK